MKQLKYYEDRRLKTQDEVFDYLVKTLRPGVADWHYFVDWDKVFKNTRDVEVILNTLNYLLGKENFESEFKFLAKKNPEILKAIPVLIVRNADKSSRFDILTISGTEMVEESFEFNIEQPSEQEIEAAVDFIKRSGLIRIFDKDGVKNLVDYVLGVEAGLGSNGRKNRAGKSMENLSEMLLKNLGCNYIAQATQRDIKDKFGIELKDSEGRQYDFAVLNNGELFVIEVNSYSGGGSKLDKTASDYRALQDDLRGQATFVWITDGYGWRKTRNPLRKTFDHNDYILNIQMINEGALKEILASVSDRAG